MGVCGGSDGAWGWLKYGDVVAQMLDGSHLNVVNQIGRFGRTDRGKLLVAQTGRNVVAPMGVCAVAQMGLGVAHI